MNDLPGTMLIIRSTILKSSLCFLFIYLFLSIRAQQPIYDSVEINRRIAFQDSIFKGLIKPHSYSSPKEDKKSKVVKTISVDSTIKQSQVNLPETSMNQSTMDSAKDINLTEKKIKTLKTKKTDTTYYSPKKAAVWGAAFPGLGQVYNKRYWKLPIVYGVLGTVLYFVASNGKKLKTFNGYIRNVYDSIPNPEPYTDLSLGQIESFRNTYRRNVQIASFGTIFAWGLSIVDAVVDAHLRSFDMSDKLTLKVKPQINYSNFTYYTGIGVHLNFK